MSVPNPPGQIPPVGESRLVKRATPSHRNSVLTASYRLLLIVSVVVLVLALLALLAAAIAFIYVRWFSERAILARAVNRGLKRNEFHLEYQPVFYTRTRKCIGLEAVLRWKNVAYGFRGEAWYMDKLADRRTTRKIIAFILSTAETELSLLANGRNLYLMVNLWKSCLGNEDCLSLIATRAEAFTASRLVFQIKAEDVPKRLSSMARLRRDKVRIALSGVRTPTAITASMLPVGFEFIKVDREVMGLEESDRLQTLQSIAAMGRQLDVAVIADGVEGIGQNHAVERAQIELAQGFFLGKAISAVRLPMLFERLERWRGKHVPAASSVGLLR
ncbi:EAL domain, c-di-GMP-specific phosphodiesterase class I (or its enzymatically inactive variant) [Paraburkholderia lycopersici]|uniref:EAL domain, c-di-GMP-specific phosphodiesterase class I (Or its enzymatically inactive variant) n=2 Tax=Paraburkholderia lycopersici TaxID=416944 RepID=A0A1G6W7C6_9BURK|nr:EAL domain, c-di-GMP-specific phosphodiesterase class I (or its enzymatically inactive variant) [Paraburkholderia lycopersici]